MDPRLKASKLGKLIDETTIVQKILRSLPKRFQSKKASIQEFQDLNEIKLGKLVGKLITYEMELDMDVNDSKKRKEVALQGVVNNDGEMSPRDDDLVLNDNEEMTYDELCIKYDTLFDETCTTKVEKIELTKKVVELQKENKSLRLVKTELDENIGYLEAHIEELNKKDFHYNDKEEKDDVITALEAQSSSMESVKPRSKWVQKVSHWCLVILNVSSATKPNVWYLDSGCSSHMSRGKDAFPSLSPFNGGGVVFEGLKSSFISMSQLCDEVADEVCFFKKGCRIMDEHGKNILVILRSGYNCYILDASKVGDSSKFNKAFDDVIVLWHRRPGHVNFKDHQKLFNREAVRGLPLLSVSDSYVCGSC
ncbi:uncharacterized protein [Malus domestica]|uniref:uncharacterized protein n=1 Tax=Malus domestica TaxID=3750 RepID=UPI0039768FC7